MLAPLDPLDGEAVLPLADAKAWLRVDGGDEDDTIKALRDAAIEWVERYCAVALAQRRWRWSGATFASALSLPLRPILSIEQVAYLDGVGVSVPIPSDRWFLRGNGVGSRGGWPAVDDAEDAVQVTMLAGYGADWPAPDPLLTAVRLLLQHLFANRSAVIVGTIATEAPLGVLSLCAPYRLPTIR